MAEPLPRQDRTGRTGGPGLATTTVTGDLDMEKGEEDVQVTREGLTVPSEEYHHGVGEGDKTPGCPPGIGEQMPPLTHSSSDTESESRHEESEILPPLMSGKIETKGYNTHLIVAGSDEADLTDDDSVSVTGGMGNIHAGGEHIDRVSLLEDIYTTTRMIGDVPGLERV